MSEALRLTPEEELFLLEMRGMDATELSLWMRVTQPDVIIQPGAGGANVTAEVRRGNLEVWAIEGLNLSFVARSHFSQGVPLGPVIEKLEVKYAST